MGYFSDLDIRNKEDPDYRIPYCPPAEPKKCWINLGRPHCYFNCTEIDVCRISTKLSGTGQMIQVGGIWVWEAK